MVEDNLFYQQTYCVSQVDLTEQTSQAATRNGFLSDSCLSHI